MNSNRKSECIYVKLLSRSSNLSELSHTIRLKHFKLQESGKTNPRPKLGITKNVN